MGQHRPNHIRTISYSPHCASICRGSRVTQSIHVATLEKFVSAACPRHDVWLDRQLRFHILAYPCAEFRISPLYWGVVAYGRLKRCVLELVSRLRIQFLRLR
jgi:hypothetical protein